MPRQHERRFKLRNFAARRRCQAPAQARRRRLLATTFSIPTLLGAAAAASLAGGLLPQPATAAVSPQASSFPGTTAVGALFTMRHGRPAVHFCSASVVDSAAGDLVLTAAHCVTGLRPRDFAFVPDYDDGSMPYGYWKVTTIYVDKQWSSSADPDDDYAFITVHRPGYPSTTIESLTGGLLLGGALDPDRVLQVIGYPDTLNTPISCRNQGSLFMPTQIEFACGGYTLGTSGGPVLTRLPGLRTAVVIGVIGGYQEGGDTPAISYAARFRSSFSVLYAEASSS